jgi:catechol 2,3-dioxygenase-like lactoylglutathione lyase family enzyme
MIESSIAITAAAHLSPLVDTADLDGNLLLEADPYVGATVVAGRIVLPEGPGLELFEYLGPEQRNAAHPSDLGWQHLAIYADDLDETLARVEAAGGTRNSDPRDLRGDEAGPGNRFVYTRTPWGSTLELVSYPTPQPYLVYAPRPKWAPWPMPDDVYPVPAPAVR